MSNELDEQMTRWEANEARWAEQRKNIENQQIQDFDAENHMWRRNGFTQEMFEQLPREAQLFVIRCAERIETFTTLMEDIHELSR